MDEKTSALIPLIAWPHAWPSVSGLRAMVARSADIGADVWIVRVGARVLIDPQKFWAWCALRSSESARSPKAIAKRRGAKARAATADADPLRIAPQRADRRAAHSAATDSAQEGQSPGR